MPDASNSGRPSVSAMAFYDRYPMLRPYVGARYGDSTTRLLLVGESHYLPDDSRQHHNPADWYTGTSATMTPCEIKWISTAQILRGAVREKFRKRAHWIWKNAFETINAAGPKYADATRVADDLAFYNFFLRPALKGQSLACKQEDDAMANEAFALHHGDLQPTAVIFLSVLAHNHFRAPQGVNVIATTHPTSPWWNRKSRMRGNKSGRQILFDYVATTAWP